MKVAAILCSGGIDSVTTAYYVKNKLKYDSLKIIFFNYSQRTLEKERFFSKKCAEELDAEFIEIPLKWLGEISTSIINSEKKHKNLKKIDLKDTKKESEKWYVPCRNTLFITHAFAFIESKIIKENNSYDLFLGFKCEGEESYPDTTKNFVKLMNTLGEISCNKKIGVYAPLIERDKEDIIILAKKLDVNLENTFSCYVGKDNHCGSCLSCKLRQAGFYWANLPDPTKYKNS